MALCIRSGKPISRGSNEVVGFLIIPREELN
ncbi:hypothetical protein T4D_467 [Trichinella pseudospiralis]|uniref:Uncharacterized protein n=1 Tax=Trichinella pseudospiralis TaxID=6337 RepID=A0A0V1FQW9_TRIPS|nr:hypothetical protein T4D_467 [Trichinella pseudospiralis]